MARRPPASRRCSIPPRSSRCSFSARSCSTPDDMPNVVKIQAGYKAQPLSAYLHQPAPPAAPPIQFPPINEDMVKTNFFQYLDFALQFAPAGPEEKAIRAKLARIGIGAGKTVRLRRPRPRTQTGSRPRHEGRRARKWTKKCPPARQKHQRLAHRFAHLATAQFYHGDWLLRAAAAKAGIYGNSADEAMYPMTRTPAGRRNARWQQTQLHAHVSGRPVAAGQRLLVSHDV